MEMEEERKKGYNNKRKGSCELRRSLSLLKKVVVDAKLT